MRRPQENQHSAFFVRSVGPFLNASKNSLGHRFTKAMDPYVFLPAAALVILFVGFGSFFPDRIESVFSSAQQWIATYFGWFYVLVTLLLLLFCVVIIFSDWGRVRLGPDDSEPEYGRISWLAMLFSAGMGTGLVFWSVAEPIDHLQNGGLAANAVGMETERAALVYSLFHWGLHPWAVYSIFALAIAYFHFRKGQPLAPRSLLTPLTDQVSNPAGRTFDVICTVGTLFGVSTSLGLGAMQINAGIREYASIGSSTAIQVGIISCITLVATISVVSGIDQGIRRLSLANMVLAGVLTLVIFLLGPTRNILHLFISSTGQYLQKLPALSTYLAIDREGSLWQAEWTFFYWGWWISWSPFVGVFVARISRGRTIREFVICVLLVPTLATIAWLSIYGGTALEFNKTKSDFPVAEITETPSRALHLLLDYLPLGWLWGPLATLLIVTFFVTSSDSGSLVDDIVTSGGHPNPPRIQRVFWAVSEGLVAITLLIAGGLQALQTASLTVGLPMAIVLLMTSYGLWIEMRRGRHGATDDAK